MKKALLGVGSLAAGLAVAAVALFGGPARSQLQAAPSFVPIGTSSSGAASTVWFHEPSTRQVLACQTVNQGAGLSIQCARSALPG